MTLADWFRMLARYNCIANQRLYESCSALSDSEYRKQRQVSFGSIHALLNHVLLGDRIWMSRFEGGGSVTPPLNTVLFEQFVPLRDARASEDARIVAFFEQLSPAFLTGQITYTNSRGVRYAEDPANAVGHFFNHATHHRGQAHATFRLFSDGRLPRV